MNEDFLYYLWTYYLGGKSFVGTAGERIQIVKQGQRNLNSGPDFSDGRIRIDQTLWAGNIEMHIKASDWYKHRHQTDPTYNNIILHVVFEADKIISRQNGTPIPTLELKGKFDDAIFQKYQGFLLSDQWIPCQNDLARVGHFELKNWMHRLAIERLEQKTKRIQDNLFISESNFNEVFYIALLRSFGFKTNSDAFEQLGRALPYLMLAKHRTNLMQLEALLFGQAGLLRGDFRESYPLQLKAEYEFLAQKYSLLPLNAGIWKFMRMRPANFPSIRISQFANIFFKSTALIRKILEAERLQDVIELFHATTSPYWHTHFRFDHPGTKTPHTMGKPSINLILINTIIPFAFVYGQYKKDTELEEKALNWLTELPAEKNTITRHFENLKVTAANAMQSQALIQLKNYYCAQKQCLHCGIGHYLLKNVSE